MRHPRGDDGGDAYLLVEQHGGVARTLRPSRARDVYEGRGEGATYVEGESRAGSFNGRRDSQYASAMFGEVVVEDY
jgi:hypothetical protein